VGKKQAEGVAQVVEHLPSNCKARVQTPALLKRRKTKKSKRIPERASQFLG
jgi:hypothetical protein